MTAQDLDDLLLAVQTPGSKHQRDLVKIVAVKLRVALTNHASSEHVKVSHLRQDQLPNADL